MSATRASFVERFGEDQARAVEAAAAEHKNGIHDNQGSDAFRWAIVICIGYECMEIDAYREHHGITTPWPELKRWIRDHGDLAHHDGGADYVSLLCGKYNEYMPDSSDEASQ